MSTVTEAEQIDKLNADLIQSNNEKAALVERNNQLAGYQGEAVDSRKIISELTAENRALTQQLVVANTATANAEGALKNLQAKVDASAAITEAAQQLSSALAVLNAG